MDFYFFTSPQLSPINKIVAIKRGMVKNNEARKPNNGLNNEIQKPNIKNLISQGFGVNQT